jgi:hypothetical protein
MPEEIFGPERVTVGRQQRETVMNSPTLQALNSKFSSSVALKQNQGYYFVLNHAVTISFTLGPLIDPPSRS